MARGPWQDLGKIRCQKPGAAGAETSDRIPVPAAVTCHHPQPDKALQWLELPNRSLCKHTWRAWISHTSGNRTPRAVCPCSGLSLSHLVPSIGLGKERAARKPFRRAADTRSRPHGRDILAHLVLSSGVGKQRGEGTSGRPDRSCISSKNFSQAFIFGICLGQYCTAPCPDGSAMASETINKGQGTAGASVGPQMAQLSKGSFSMIQQDAGSVKSRELCIKIHGNWPTSLKGASEKWRWDEREWALLSEIPQGSNGGCPGHLRLHLLTDKPGQMTLPSMKTLETFTIEFSLLLILNLKGIAEGGIVHCQYESEC